MDQESKISKFLLYGMYFLAAYLPWQIALNPAKDIDLASVRVIVAILFLVYLFEGRSAEKIKQLGNYVTLGIVVFLVFSAISIISTAEMWWGVRKILFLLNVAMLYPLVLWTLNLQRRIEKFFKIFLVSASLAAVVALVMFFLQFVVGYEAIRIFLTNNIAFLFWGNGLGYEVVKNPSWLVGIGDSTYFRALGLFPDPHTFAFFIGFALPMAIGFYVFEKKKIYLASVIVLASSLFLAFSRSGYLGMLVSLSVCVMLFIKKINLKGKIFLMGLLIITAVVLFIPLSPVSSRFYSTFNASEGSNASRLGLWQEAIDLSLAHPLLGVGLGNYAYYVSGSNYYRQPTNAHNTYLEIFAEAGVFAIVGLLLAIGFAVTTLVKKIRHAKKEAVLYFALLGSLVWFAVASFFETSLYSPQTTALFFIFLALSQIKHELPQIDGDSEAIMYGVY